MTDQDTVVTSVDAVLSEDGYTMQLQFVRNSGRTSFVNIPASRAQTFLADIQRAISSVPAKRKVNGTPGEHHGSSNAAAEDMKRYF